MGFRKYRNRMTRRAHGFRHSMFPKRVASMRLSPHWLPEQLDRSRRKRAAQRAFRNAERKGKSDGQ